MKNLKTAFNLNLSIVIILSILALTFTPYLWIFVAPFAMILPACSTKS